MAADPTKDGPEGRDKAAANLNMYSNKINNGDGHEEVPSTTSTHTEVERLCRALPASSICGNGTNAADLSQQSMVLAGAVEYIAQLEKERDEHRERAARKAEYVAQLETERDGYRKESERLQRLHGRKEEYEKEIQKLYNGYDKRFEKELARQVKDRLSQKQRLMRITEANQNNSLFLRLPGEVRNKIYGYAFEDLVLMRTHRGPSHYTHNIWSLPHSCRQLFAEIVPIIYQSGTFCSDLDQTLERGETRTISPSLPFKTRWNVEGEVTTVRLELRKVGPYSYCYEWLQLGAPQHNYKQKTKVAIEVFHVLKDANKPEDAALKQEVENRVIAKLKKMLNKRALIRKGDTGVNWPSEAAVQSLFRPLFG